MTVTKPRILAVDDEADMLATYQSVLKKNFQVLTAASGEQALKAVQAEPLALVLLDVRMPGQDGLQVLKKIKDYDANLEVIMITASRDIAAAVEAMKLGAFEYVTKPFDVKELQALIDKALEKSALVRENLYLRASLAEITQYFDLIGKTPQMRKLYETIDQVGPTDSTVLIHGESGTGKELVARAIHKKSRRASLPFITVNCAAIPENLFESELFGHERGAFTGALERRLGKFELANNGTLFLDEIGCLSAPMQAKLLRVLEDKTVERVGGEKSIPVNARLVSATNIDFKKEIHEGKFRPDLYYRLNVIPVSLTPLRERIDDLPLFVEYFINKFNRTLNKNVRALSPATLAMLKAYRWPGNVRELQNLMERLVVLAKSDIIDQLDLPFGGELPDDNYKAMIENFERHIIQNAVEKNQGNVSQAARTLKIARSSLTTRMKALGMTQALT